MDKLALETRQYIFELACADGGRTGCALSLTSHAIRATSRRMRFRTVALVAHPESLTSFVALYGREHAPAQGDKARVAHLYVTFPELADVAHVVPVRAHSPAHDSYRRRLVLPRGYMETARTLFQLVAPDLRSLVLHVEAGDTRATSVVVLRVLPPTFPKVRDVTFVRIALHSRVLGGPCGPGSTHTHEPLFPTVTRALFILPPPMWVADRQVDALVRHMPHLAHLRLPCAVPPASTTKSSHAADDAVRQRLGTNETDPEPTCDGRPYDVDERGPRPRNAGRASSVILETGPGGSCRRGRRSGSETKSGGWMTTEEQPPDGCSWFGGAGRRFERRVLQGAGGTSGQQLEGVLRLQVCELVCGCAEGSDLWTDSGEEEAVEEKDDMYGNLGRVLMLWPYIVWNRPPRTD